MLYASELVSPFTALLVVVLPPIFVDHSQNGDARQLQQDGIQRIEQYSDYFKKTGDRRRLIPQLEEAERELAESYDLFIRYQDRSSAAMSAIKLGDALRIHGLSAPAVERYMQALDIARQTHEPVLQAKALLGRAKVTYFLADDLGSALGDAEEALQLCERGADRELLFDALSVTARVLRRLGELIAAVDRVDRGLALAIEMNTPELLADAHELRADVFLERSTRCDYAYTFESCHADAATARTEYEQAQSLYSKLGYAALSAFAAEHVQRTDARDRLITAQSTSIFPNRMRHPKGPDDMVVQDESFVKSSGAWQMPKTVIETATKQFGAAGDARSAFIRGMLAQMGDDGDRALREFLDAVRLLEQDRRALPDESARTSFFEGKINFYYAPIPYLLERKQFAEAFELMERARARSMSDLLGTKDAGGFGPPYQQLYVDLLTTRSRIAGQQTQLFRERNRTGATHDGKTIDRLEKDIQHGEDEYRLLVARAGREAPRLQQLLISKPITLEALQQSARDEGYEVFYYLLQPNGIIIWRITGQDVQVRNVFLPRRDLAESVSRLRKSLSDVREPFDRQTARELYLFLIRPIFEKLKTNRVVIIPHEDLNQIPFQVLEDPESGRSFGEQLQISYAPSATILLRLPTSKNIAGAKLIAAANPHLEDARNEVLTVGRLYPIATRRLVTDTLISESDLKASVGRYEVVHLAVHGTFEGSNPLFSHLELGKDATNDGVLTAAEMFGLPLDNARLVVLSACESGTSVVTHSNETLGIVRGLLFAGAKAIVVSLWPVQSDSTRLWMETFYREAQTQTLTEAARLALIAVKAHREYDHPSNWAPFVVVGR